MQFLNNLFIVQFEENGRVCLCAWSHLLENWLFFWLGLFEEFVVVVGCPVLGQVWKTGLLFCFVQHCRDYPVVVGYSAFYYLVLFML